MVRPFTPENESHMLNPIRKNLSRGYLRDIALVLAALQLLDMQKNGYVRKPDSGERDIDLDIDFGTKDEIAEQIGKLEGFSKNLTYKVKYSAEEEKYIKAVAKKIIDLFFDEPLLSKGVCPELFFASLLYVNFCKGYLSEEDVIIPHHKIFVDANIYDDIFQSLEDSIIFDMKAHLSTAEKIIEKSIGLRSCVIEENKNIKAISRIAQRSSSATK